MPEITIQGTTIDFPESGTSPNWADAIVQFAESVETALSLSVGSSDISPQNYVIDAYNAVSNQSIPSLQFSTSQVRAAHVRYAVYRSTSAAAAYEAGTLTCIYNTNGGSWEMSREYVGDGKIAFNITSAGQIQFSTNATSGTTAASLAGSSHTGKIFFAAQALLQS